MEVLEGLDSKPWTCRDGSSRCQVLPWHPMQRRSPTFQSIHIPGFSQFNQTKRQNAWLLHCLPWEEARRSWELLPLIVSSILPEQFRASYYRGDDLPEALLGLGEDTTATRAFVANSCPQTCIKPSSLWYSLC